MGLTDDIQGWHVLVVDDEPDNRGVVEKVLTFYGARVATARNGVEGMEVLSHILPTFVLLDLSMPRMDGWAMIKAIRANPVIAALPVIALTAHAMDTDRERAMVAGFDGYLTKPFRLITFLEDLRNCLQQVKDKQHKEQISDTQGADGKTVQKPSTVLPGV